MSGNGSLKKQESLTDEQQTIINQKTAKIERLQTDITNLSKPLLGVDDTKDNNKNNWVKNIATPNVLSVFQDNSSWNKFSLKPDSPLLKQQSSYQERLQEVNGSSWNKMKDVLTTANDILEGDDHVSENEIATTKLNYRDMKTYGNMPMEDDVIVVNCNHCKRPILPSSFKEHMEKCGNKNDKETKKNGNKDNANGSNNSNSNPKKRIAAQTFFSDNDDDDDDDDDDHMGTTKQKDSNKDSSTTVKKKKKSVKVNNNSSSTSTNNKENTTTTTTATATTSTNSEDTTNSINTKRPPPNNNNDTNKNNDNTTNTTDNNNNTSEKVDNKKKTKKEKSKSKSAKQKAPLDLDKQCGVIQIPNGTPCTRSLTCKSHSMGAKRAVAGRSQPYDVLLAAYQKKAIGRPQSGASGTGNNKNVKIKKPSSSSSSTTTPSASNNNISGANGNNGLTSDNVINSTSSTSNTTATTITTNNQNNNQSNEDYFDSDEEVENIMQALRSNHPTPLAQKPYFYVKRKRQCYRLRDILLEAITPKEKESSSSSTTTHLIQDSTSSNNNIYQNNNKSNTPYSSTFQVSSSSSTSSSSSIHRHLQQQQQQQLALLSPTSNNMNYSGIYMDGMSPTSPAASIASTYSIR